MGRLIDLTGARFGRLTLLGPNPQRTKQGSIMWDCLCDCGVTTKALAPNLKSGDIRSCGCLARELSVKRATIHGQADSREYRSWAHAKGRCENPRDAAFVNYGGRGISMCERWSSSFGAFIEDLGPCPTGKTLDRFPNNDGNYEPGNCRWATRREQNSNKRSTVRISFNGKSLLLDEWADELGVPLALLKSRRRRGWPVEKMLAIPSGGWLTHFSPIPQPELK